MSICEYVFYMSAVKVNLSLQKLVTIFNTSLFDWDQDFRKWRYMESSQDRLTIGPNCSNGTFVRYRTCNSLFHTTPGTFHNLTVLDCNNAIFTEYFHMSTANDSVSWVIPIILAASKLLLHSAQQQSVLVPECYA